MNRTRTSSLDAFGLRDQRNRIYPAMEGGDGSTLSLDFTAMSSLDSRFTFTRASTGTYINSNGLVTTMAAASTNDPTKARFDYDPTTLAPRGLLIEGSATNLLNWSESFATTGGTNNNWADTNITRNSTNNTDPANGTTALRITASAGNGTIISSAAMGTSAERTFSIWLRRVSGTGNIQYTLNNGSTYTTQAITSSWVRYTFAATTAAQRVGIRIVTSGDSIELWGAQLEAGSGASSYVFSGASQGQRAADVCTMTGANFTSWYGAPTGWTLVTETIPQSRAASTFPGMVALRSSADSGLRIYYYNDGTYNTAFRFATASSSSEVFGPNSVTYGLARKFGASVTSGTQIASSAGVQIGSTQTLAVPMDQTVLGIGNDGATTPTVNCRMHVRNIKYWPYAMTLAQLNGVTA